MFDPYHKWLGIPKEQQPPTYYQLLSIQPGESDPEVIEEAAIRQSTHLRGYQVGQHAADCTKLLNEVAHAKAVLLNPAKRQAYDATLSTQQAIQPKRVLSLPSSNPAPDQTVTASKPKPKRPEIARSFDDEDVADDISIKKRHNERSRRPWTAGQITAVVCVFAFVIVPSTIAVGFYMALQRERAAEEAARAEARVAREAEEGARIRAGAKPRGDFPNLPAIKAQQPNQQQPPPIEPKPMPQKKPQAAPAPVVEKKPSMEDADLAAANWDLLDTTGFDTSQGFLEVRFGNVCYTKQKYSGPLEITAVARTEKENIRLFAYRGSNVIFNWENMVDELRVHRPDGGDGLGTGSSIGVPFKPIPPKTWTTVRWRIASDGMQVLVNDKTVFLERKNNDVSHAGKLAIGGNTSIINVRSYEVRPLREPLDFSAQPTKAQSPK